MGESKSEQVLSAVDFVMAKLAIKSNFSLVLFSSRDQKNFIDHLRLKNQVGKKLKLPSPKIFRKWHLFVMKTDLGEE